MITSKKEYSELCLSIRKHLVDSGNDIKLASIRETLAIALGYNTASALLVNLPSVLTENAYKSLNALLRDNHRINSNLTPSNLPYPKSLRLTEDEIKLAWADYLEILSEKMKADPILNFAVRASTGGDFTTLSPPTGMKPDGSGTWICEEHNGLSRLLGSFSLSSVIDQIGFSNALAEVLLKNITPALNKYWDDNEGWLITKAAARILKSGIPTSDGEYLNLSEHIHTPFSKFVEKFGNIGSSTFNRYELVHPYKLHSKDTLNTYLCESLVQGALGHCILNEIGDFNYDELLWEYLDEVKPFKSVLSSSMGARKHEHFNEFIYHQEFKEGVRVIGLQWLASHPDWSKTLKELTLREFPAPAPLEFPHFRSKDGEFDMVCRDDSLHAYVNPHGRFEDEFGYHDEIVDDFEVKSISDFLESDEQEKKALSELLEKGEIDESDYIEMLESYNSEAYSDAEEAHSEYMENLPFLKPFCLESLAIERRFGEKDSEFVAYGEYFSDLDETSDIGLHFNLLDAISQVLCDISEFVRINPSEFGCGDSDLFYVTELVLSKGATPKSIAREIKSGVELSGKPPRDCVVVINAEALTHAYFVGAPYKDCEPLREVYWAFVNELMDELKKYFEHAIYIKN
ncbi:hypothetical protein [Vibrio alginolyticus]|uniref:hypothetical protein n=1 Tax=Vibrio alginolyticus TaxID=663 RepID=UPI0006CA8897|nr:hypothetical protein [Vibrio alginolyticus]KPM97562.1 hypothetical protein AOG25_13920 [Vibrio alginolyticus]